VRGWLVGEGCELGLGGCCRARTLAVQWLVRLEKS